MKKHYITPAIESVNIVATESVMVTGSLGSDTTGTMDANGRRSSWGNFWDDSAEFDASTEE